MEDITFQTELELYKRVKPALIAKKRELERLGFKYIKERDIWQFLKEFKWNKRKNLMLVDVVSDILHSDNKKIDAFVKKEWEKKNINLFDDEII